MSVQSFVIQARVSQKSYLCVFRKDFMILNDKELYALCIILFLALFYDTFSWRERKKEKETVISKN